MVTVFKKDGAVRMQAPCDDNSTQSKELQGENVLALSFTLYEHVELEVGDYADFLGERYFLTEQYKPEQASTVEWKYDIRLYGVESLVNRFLVLDDTDGADEPVFTLTAPPAEHAALIVRNINNGMGTTDWKTGDVAGAGNIVIDYRGKRCGDALKEVAGKAGRGAEWWVDGTTVNVCRCERGGEIALGYGRGLAGLGCDMADNADFYTRLYPIGSSRNIDPEAYGHSRLQLPGGRKHVDVNVEKFGVWHRYEQDAFAGIYPRYTGTVSSVRGEEREGADGGTYTAWFFKDDGLPFDPADYVMGGKGPRVSFQEGSALAGLGTEEDGTYFFEAAWHGDTREWEIVTAWPYGDGTPLPGGSLLPAPGDRYIPWNMRMPDEYYALAEQEFQEAVDAYNRENALDVSRYKAQTDHVWVEENGAELYVGRRVRLESDEYFPGTGFRSSRITRITRRVNLPSQMDLEIGDALSVSSRESMNGSIEGLREYVLGVSGKFPDVVRSWERTPASDHNVYSSLRSLLSFLRKDADDRTPFRLAAGGRLTAEDGMQAGKDFVPGIVAGRGGLIDKDGNGELESLVLRRFLEVPELRYNRVQVELGDKWNAPGAGIIAEAAPDTDGTGAPAATGTARLKLEEGETGAIAAGDICMGIFHSGNPSDNAGQDGDDSRGNFEFAGFYTCYFTITEVAGAGTTPRSGTSCGRRAETGGTPSTRRRCASSATARSRTNPGRPRSTPRAPTPACCGGRTRGRSAPRTSPCSTATFPTWPCTGRTCPGIRCTSTASISRAPSSG